MNLKLLVVQGKPEGKLIPIKSPRFLIGRGPECHLRPNSELVSRNHSLLTTEGEVIRLRDLGSTNGTLVNGQRIEGEVELKAGDVVLVGPLGFMVMLETAAVPVAASAPAEPVAVASPQPSRVAKLGSKDAKESDIEQWLLADSKHIVPDSGSGVFSGDTQMLERTAVEQAAHTDTKSDLSPPAGAVPIDAESKPAEERPQAEDDPKPKNGGAKKPKTKKEDASNVAADLLRRMMERRPRG